VGEEEEEGGKGGATQGPGVDGATTAGGGGSLPGAGGQRSLEWRRVAPRVALGERRRGGGASWTNEDPGVMPMFTFSNLFFVAQVRCQAFC
jgi:hypothetical protein